jgi:hypothetical protein
MMASPTNTITINFPYPIICPLYNIISDPTFATIQVTTQLQLNANANAASVNSNGGNGCGRHLTVTIWTANYNALSTENAQFTVPANPPMQTTIPLAPHLPTSLRSIANTVGIKTSSANTTTLTKLYKATPSHCACHLHQHPQ